MLNCGDYLARWNKDYGADKNPFKLIEENSLHDQKQQTSNINNSKKIYMALIRTVDVCF